MAEIENSEGKIKTKTYQLHPEMISQWVFSYMLYHILVLVSRLIFMPFLFYKCIVFSMETLYECIFYGFLSYDI